MKTRRGFTLIELLVVISIIALLLSILVPALNRVKQQATSAVCLANLKGLTACWHTYATDNEDEIVNGHAPRGFVTDHEKYGFWVDTPQTKDGQSRGEPDQVTLEYEQNGIQRGRLFPYVEAVDAYHCPGDKSDKKGFDNPSGNKSWFNSYSITGMMNGEEEFRDNPDAANKSTEITSPGNKVVFLENIDERGWLMGSWLMNYDSTQPTWVDPIAIWHKDRGSLGFADGHAEVHQWVDESTLANAEAGRVIESNPWTLGESGDDVRFMQQAYVAGRK